MEHKDGRVDIWHRLNIGDSKVSNFVAADPKVIK